MKKLMTFAAIIFALHMTANAVGHHTDTGGWCFPPKDTPALHFIEPNADDVELLARLIYSEAAGESADAMLMVGAVVLNRAKRRHAGRSDALARVIHARGQFDGVGGRLWKRWDVVEYEKRRVGDKRAAKVHAAIAAAKERARVAARLALQGRAWNVPSDIMYFANAAISTDTGWLARLSEWKTVGNHSFYHELTAG